MRKSKEVKEEVLSRSGRYSEVHLEGVSAKDPSPLKVKKVTVDDCRYIVCTNENQARKDTTDRQAIIASLVQPDPQEKKIMRKKTEKISEADRDESLAGQGGTGEGSIEYSGLPSKPLRRIF